MCVVTISAPRLGTGDGRGGDSAPPQAWNLPEGPSKKRGAGGGRLSRTEGSTEKGGVLAWRAALAGADVQLPSVVMVAPWGGERLGRGAGATEGSPSPAPFAVYLPGTSAEPPVDALYHAGEPAPASAPAP